MTSLIFKITILLIFASCALLSAGENEEAQIKVMQGEVFTFTLAKEEDMVDIKGSLLGRSISFFKINEALYGALIGIDMEDEAETHELRIEISKKNRQPVNKVYRIKVVPGKFGREELTLPKEAVELDDEALKRVAIEKKKTVEVLSGIREERLWKSGFVIPAEGKLTENFGSKRILNGLSRAPHNGVDISAPAGTEVIASNDGIVVMVDDLFFAGKSIFIDHGQGIYTFYFHLSKVNVSLGDAIKKGDLIGLIGSSGRAKGPHLHWGMRINGARVNPISATRISLE